MSIYDFLIGSVTQIEDGVVVLENQGIGYEIHVAHYQPQDLPAEQKLFIHEHVSEGEHTLFGFPTRLGKTVFIHLIGVSGVGPKMAIRILDQFFPEQVLQILGAKNIAELRKVKGLGVKTAEKIIIELHKKSKEMMMMLSLETAAVPSSFEEEAVAALIGLGYKEQSIRGIVSQAVSELEEDKISPTAEVVIKKALEKLAKLK